MATTARRLTILTTALLTSLLAACANPTAPSARKAPAAVPPSQDVVVQGSVG